MEETRDLVLYIVIASSAVVLLLVAIVFDLFLLFRKRKIIAQQEIQIRDNKIDELIMKKEVESVNALLKGQNSERRRISQELHDRLGSILFTAKLYNSNMEAKIRELKNEQEESFGKLTGLLDEAVQEVRRISHDLYAGSLSEFGYTVALRQLISALQQDNKLKIEFNAETDVENQKEAIQYELYAITQELLSNTLKHAEASTIQIDIRMEEDLVFTYQDNGKGFDADKQFNGIGLKNIQNRVDKLKGALNLESKPGKGSFYHISIPIAS
jgi:signal transduction histidine kinase